MLKFVLISLSFGLFFLTCVSGIIGRQREIQQYFAMPAYVGPVPEHVELAVLKSIHLGSSRQEVDGFLQRRGIGTDGNSDCELSNDQHRLTCNFGRRHHFWELFQERYTIIFGFGFDQTLRNIDVKSRFEGPSR